MEAFCGPDSAEGRSELMERYVAITIGPIYDTLNLASSPASLWAGSYLFSYLTKTLCRLLVEAGVPESDILTPYYATDESPVEGCDGVGLYHDRIVFRAGNFKIACFAQIRQDAITHLAQVFCVDKEFLQEYLLIAAAVKEVTNPILDMGRIMDSFELAKPIVRGRENNPLLSLLIGEQNYGNEAVKKLEIVKGFCSWQLLKSSGSLKSIPDIAAAGIRDKLKKHSYFAIVRADGDHMGDIIKNLPVENIRSFSKNCLIYCGRIAQLVGKYGGVTIYSGGDDLLALMPCENAEGKTIFAFIQEANALFAESFPKETYHADVSLSWGVTICYQKYPLYEALDDSCQMLAGIAKSRRNCVAVHLQKHAGQSEGLLIPNTALAEFVNLMEQCISGADGEWLHSIHHKLNAFRKMFDSAQKPETVRNLFANLFDAEAHQNNNLIHKLLPEFFWNMKTELDIVSVEAAKEREPIDTLCYILRLFKFFVEKEGNQ